MVAAEGMETRVQPLANRMALCTSLSLTEVEARLELEEESSG